MAVHAQCPQGCSGCMITPQIQTLLNRAEESHQAAKVLLDLDPKYHRRLIIAERRRETGHYGEESGVSEEEALESFQWAEEFMQVVKDHLGA